ncbi:hypothetical protein [uncultured Winogradskyella sp.]|uniref:hypothetical protein n=1 Tax=uncultured Winogradskyella sp. TaxID=395353 RepID=UPI002615D444|nr:hypothetical protein [uncultured Winogradskyella sp.]|tara:strand:+ start:1020 stop:1682 length:663 start_codon:yes stop_codon:yes gene_type:complete
MKRSLIIILTLVLFSCNSTQLTENWKNPDIDTYEPTKVFVIGLTSNIEARQQFENKLKTQLELRGIETVMSLDFIEPQFRTEKMTEDELESLESDLIDAGFDTILFSKVIGVEDKIEYKQKFGSDFNTNTKFRDDYLRYQDAFYNPEYYNEYTVYNAETSMSCICPTKERELIWKGYISITDPKSIEKTVSEYVNLVIAVLEDQQLINPNSVYSEPQVIK